MHKPFLLDIFNSANLPIDSKELALLLDSADQLSDFKSQFYVPKHVDGTEVIYFSGNSLGLQPKNCEKYLMEELKVWKECGVEGHFDHPFNRPWVSYDQNTLEICKKLVGAEELSEVAVANSLTTNLHLLMIPFYQPNSSRFKILIEGKAFPSDYIYPRKGEFNIQSEDLMEIIEKQGDQIALILLSGVQYYTGQVFDMQAITKVGHQKGCIVGFDLAHAVGNIPLKLHDWNVDFAVWCNYKYLNSGPGAVGGYFVHKSHDREKLKQFAGWWGHNPVTRFKMEHEFDPIVGASRFQLSNANVLSNAALLASLEIFDKVDFEQLRDKSLAMVCYLRALLAFELEKEIKIITPLKLEETGCQTSLLLASGNVKSVMQQLRKNGVICDEREPDVIRVAPVPLYNSFMEIFNFVQILKSVLKNGKI